MFGWDLYKKYFNAWESTTAQYLEACLRSPLVLEPVGAWLTVAMKAKRASDRSAASFWGAIGLPTKRDQERSLHALNQIQSRLADLEERLEELTARGQLGRAPAAQDAE